MAANNDARVDTTFIGCFLIGFVLLLLGVLGLQDGGLFGDFSGGNASYKDLPVDYNICAEIIGVVGLILVILAIFGYRTGHKNSALMFTFFGATFIFYYLNEYVEGLADVATSNSNWFLYIALAIFFLIFAIYALFAKAPKFVALLLVLVALMVFFLALCCFYDELFGPGANNDLYKAMGIVYGIFAFLGFIIATYLGLAYADPKKIPLI